MLSERMEVLSIFDNHPQIAGKYKQISLETLKEYDGNVAYILSFGSKQNREEIHEQLLLLGV